MKHGRLLTQCAVAFAFATLACNPPAPTPAPTAEAPKTETREATAHQESAAMAIEIPTSIKTEHGEIHATLVEATQAPGQVGVAAKALAEILHPHFVREEEIALPPLGLLKPLSSGGPISEADAAAALKMSDALRAELPKMLEEHKAIRAAVIKVGEAAKAENNEKFQRLAEALANHAKSEEEVMYPAAILVGDLLRARASGEHKNG